MFNLGELMQYKDIEKLSLKARYNKKKWQLNKQEIKEQEIWNFK